MKEDYLWDKTGAADPEIERLENALAVFRYQETEPPVLPAKIVPFERKQPRGFFRLAFAFAGCAALVAVCLGVWFQFSSGKVDVAKNSTETIAPQINEKIADETVVKKPADLIVKKVEVSKQSSEPKTTKTRKIATATVPQEKTVAQNISVKNTAVKLTKDEKYAYDQLMLALSITGSKLKLVKDKIDNVEEQTADIKSGR